MMHLFELHRDVDSTGISGTGVVAEGVVFTDGTCAMHWLNALTSWTVYGSVEDLRAIHGHHGDTRIVFIDVIPAAQQMTMATDLPETPVTVSSGPALQPVI